MKKKNAKLLFYIFLLIPFFPIPYINILFPIIPLLNKLHKILVFLIIILLIIKKKRFSKMNLWTTFFLILLLISTIINDADIGQCLELMITIFSLVCIIDYGIKNEPKAFLNSFEFLLYSLIVINFLSIITHPQGLYMSNSISFDTKLNWFLGYKNNHIIYILPAILISFINSNFQNNKIRPRNIILLLISFISLIMVNSSTGIVGVFVFIMLILFSKIFKITKIINIVTFISLYIITFLSVIIFRIQKILGKLIMGILHKDITLTNRTFIWDIIMEMIKEKPFLGYGIEDPTIRYYKINRFPSYHAHNQILEIIYKSGIMGLFILGYISYLSFQKLFKFKDTYAAKIISIATLSYLVIMLTEAYSLETLFIFLVFGFNVEFLKESF